MRILNPFLCAGTLVISFAATTALAEESDKAVWPQWGGPHRTGIVETTGLVSSWPEQGPPVLWSRPLGPGHSSIVSDGERLYTMYRVGNGREKTGPWDKEEIVIAMDAKDGTTLWEHKYPSRHEDFNFGSGPHATPIVIDGRVFTAGTNKQLHAFDAETGTLIWEHDLVEDFDAPSLLMRAMVKAGYGCNPIAFKDTIICSVGGPGQAVMAFRQSDGSIAWKSGDFLVSQVPPVLIEFDGQTQLVIVGGGTVNGLAPETGEILWSYPHDPGNDLNLNAPLWGANNILVVSTAYKTGTRALDLTRVGGKTSVSERWFTTRTRFMFLSAIRIGDHVYGTSGDFGPQFLTALDVETGKAAWRHRGFSRASLIYADDKAIILDEDGDLALAKLSPEGVEVLAETKLFDTMSWSAPSLLGTILYARDREKIVALQLGDP